MSKNEAQINSDQHGLRLGSRSISWPQIESIRAYKRDLFTVDQICLAISSEVGELLVNEDIPGFWDLCRRMEHQLGIPEEWFCQVSQPPFEPCETVIYLRPTLKE